MPVKSQGAESKAVHLKVADEVWIATALLHREHPRQGDFSVQQIMERVQQEGLSRPLRPGVYVHVVQHCVANRSPNPGRYRMLLETTNEKRRLFRRGDSYHPEREGGKIIPHIEEMPSAYAGLLAWYKEWSVTSTASSKTEDPLLLLRGSGKQLWANEHADDYVRRLREGWE
jgi:hypothetical protein